MTAAETGHLVFATLHTNSAPKTIERIIGAFPARVHADGAASVRRVTPPTRRRTTVHAVATRSSRERRAQL